MFSPTLDMYSKLSNIITKTRTVREWYIAARIFSAAGDTALSKLFESLRENLRAFSDTPVREHSEP